MFPPIFIQLSSNKSTRTTRRKWEIRGIADGKKPTAQPCISSMSFIVASSGGLTKSICISHQTMHTLCAVTSLMWRLHCKLMDTFPFFYFWYINIYIYIYIYELSNEWMNILFIKVPPRQNLASHMVTYEALVIQTYVHIFKYQNILTSASN